MTRDENCLPCPALPGEYTPSPQGRAGFTFLGQCSQLVGDSLSRLKPSHPGAQGPRRLGEGPVECSGVQARASMRVGSLDCCPVGLRGGGRSTRRRRGLTVTGHLAPPLSLRVKDRGAAHLGRQSHSSQGRRSSRPSPLLEPPAVLIDLCTCLSPAKRWSTSLFVSFQEAPP